MNLELEIVPFLLRHLVLLGRLDVKVRLSALGSLFEGMLVLDNPVDDSLVEDSLVENILAEDKLVVDKLVVDILAVDKLVEDILTENKLAMYYYAVLWFLAELLQKRQEQK